MTLSTAALLAVLAGAVPDPDADLLARAEGLLARRDYAAAEAILRELVRGDPANARAHGNLALSLMARGKTAEAVDAARLSAAFAPEAPQARYIYGVALRQAGRPSDAARELEMAVVLQPDRAEPLSALAAAYAEAGDERAAATYERLIVLEPADPGHPVALAEIRWLAGETESGNRIMAEARRRLPGDPDLALAYGRALVDQEKFLDAAAQLTSARDLGARGAGLDLLLGQAYREGGRPGEALRAFRQAAKSHPADASARLELGRTLLQAGRAAEALPELEEAARLLPRSAEARLDLGRALETLGRLEEAEAQYRAAASAAPASPRAHYVLGRLLLRRGRRAEAEAELARHQSLYERGLERVSEAESLRGHVNLARAMVRVNRDGAEEALRRLAGFPENPEVLVARAEAFSALRRHGEALRALERASAMAPEDRRIAARLAAERSRAENAR